MGRVLAPGGGATARTRFFTLYCAAFSRMFFVSVELLVRDSLYKQALPEQLISNNGATSARRFVMRRSPVRFRSAAPKLVSQIKGLQA
jgi:hypothetical protein